MKYESGDLVEVCIEKNIFTGLVISGRPVSLYIEDRPIRIIDEVSYTIMVNGDRKFAYEKDIHRKISEESK